MVESRKKRVALTWRAKTVPRPKGLSRIIGVHNSRHYKNSSRYGSTLLSSARKPHDCPMCDRKIKKGDCYIWWTYNSYCKEERVHQECANKRPKDIGHYIQYEIENRRKIIASEAKKILALMDKQEKANDRVT